MQIRLRIADGTGKTLATLRPALRAKVVTTILEAHALGIDLTALLAARRELTRLGVLINQSLRVSSGTMPDMNTVRQAANIVNSLTRK